MASLESQINPIDIETSLQCNHKFKKSVIQLARSFVDLSDAYLCALPSFAVDAERRNTLVEHFEQINNDQIQQQELPLGLIVFGANSSGKSTFIQHFLQIGDILPSGIGPVTARIIRMTYTPAEQARALIYTSLPAHLTSNQTPIEIDLKSFFSTSQPQWFEIRNALSKVLDRAQNSEVDLKEWAKGFVEIRLPSPILKMNIDVYDTPGFLSGNREQFLMNNLYELVKNIRPTLLFLYENSSIAETDTNCFLAMKNSIGSLDRTPIFFLNTKADVATIVKDSRMNPCDVTLNCFQQLLADTRYQRYELLRKQTAMANELLGGLPPLIDECQCFDICSIPKGRTPYRALTNHLNKESFSRIVSFAVQASSEYVDELATNILSATEDFFDQALSASYRDARHFRKLRDEALEWGTSFFSQFKADMPKITQNIYDTIIQLFNTEKAEIARKAAHLIQEDDSITILVPGKTKKVRDYIQIAVEEKIMKVAVNKTLNSIRSEVKTVLDVHFDDRMGRRNELLRIAQRHVLPEISSSMLTKPRLISRFIEGLIKLPMRIARLLRSVPTLPYIEYYNEMTHNRVTNEEDPVYKILDCLDMHARLSNESKRLAFAEQYLNVIFKGIATRQQDFQQNLDDWVAQQHKKFNESIKKQCKNIIAHLDAQQTLHQFHIQYYDKFAQIECQILAAKQLNKFNNVRPIITGENILGKGAFFNIYAAEWGSEKNLIVKRLTYPLSDHSYMVYLDAHYQRLVSLLRIRKTVPLKYLYENELENGEHELWIIMPRYPRSLRDFLCENIRNITLDKVLRFAIDIAETLAELHRNEIVHRDIKGSNVLLDENDECYLTDFGTVREGTFHNTIVGTIPLPPEMMSALTNQPGTGFTYDGAAADVYSFGLLLYEMHPKQNYHRVHPQKFEDVQRLLQDQHVRSVNGFAAFVKLIEACIQTNPSARPSAPNIVDRLRMIKKNNVDHEVVNVKECLVCFDQERQIRFQPCGHRTICESCWRELCARNEGKNCILCRGVIEGHQKDIENDVTLIFI